MKVASQNYHLGSNSFITLLPSEKVHKPYLKSSPILSPIPHFWPKAALPILSVFKDHPNRMNITALVIIHSMSSKLWTQFPEKNSVTILNNDTLISRSPTAQRWMLLRRHHLFDHRTLVHLLTTQTQDFQILPLRTADQEGTIWFNIQS